MSRTPNPALLLILLLITLFTLPDAVNAAWIKDGNVVVQKPGAQFETAAISDGQGGAFIAWVDERSNPGGGIVFYDIYVQHIDPQGNRLWNPDGVAVCTATGQQAFPRLATDGTGGVFVVWPDSRSGTSWDVYAQRISLVGVPQWAANGVSISNATNNQTEPVVASDGVGGAYVCWRDTRTDVPGDVYAQRVNSSGSAYWAANGIPVRNTGGIAEISPEIVADGSGNAIVVWRDDRFGDVDVFGQKLSPTGTFLWTASGRDLSSIIGTAEISPMIVADGAGGIYVSFQNATGNDLYVNRVNSSGTWVWPTIVPVVIAADDQLPRSMTLAEDGGVILAWDDQRAEPGSGDVYAQKIAPDGTALWNGNGLAIAVATGTQAWPQVTTDGASGAIIGWWDTRTGEHQIYAQRVDANGSIMWTTNGTVLKQPVGAAFTRGIVSDGQGGAIVIWDDGRAGHYDVRAQRVEPREGYWGYPEPVISSVADIAGDQGGLVRVSWTRSDHDVIPIQTISYYSVWRATSQAAAAAATRAAGVPLSDGETIRLVKLSDITRGFKGPAFRADADYYWEYVGQQPAIYSPTYSYAAATDADGTPHYFQVVSHASTYQTFPSAAASGTSIDNLAPGSPGLLNAVRTTGTNVDLDWSPQAASVPDFKEYAIYRDTAPGVAIEPGNFIGTTVDTMLVDADASLAQSFYYVVVAMDIHDNQSGPSNEAMVSGGPTGIGDTPTPRVLTLQPNVPNPFSASTEFILGMPHAGEATIEVYNVAGERVYAETVSGLGAGWHRVPFRGSDERGVRLASGVYFYKLRAVGATVTRKMVVVR